MSQLFASGGQSIGASASVSVLPMNIQDWFPLGLTGLIFLLSKELSRVFSSTTVWKPQFFGAHPSVWSSSHIALTIQIFVGKVLSPLFNTLSRFVIAFLPRSKCLHFMAAVTIHSDFGAQVEDRMMMLTFSDPLTSITKAWILSAFALVLCWSSVQAPSWICIYL